MIERLLIVLTLSFSGCSGDDPGPNGTEPEVGPPPPAQVVALAEQGQNRVEWTAVAGAESHNIYWTDDGSIPTKDNGNRITGVASPFTHANLGCGTEHSYVVTSKDVEGEGKVSDDVSATPCVGPLPAPERVFAGIDDRQVTVRWDDVPLASVYSIYWTDDGSTPSATNGTKIANVTSPHLHNGLTNGIEYTYVVATASSAGEGPFSEVVSGTPDPGPFIGSTTLDFQVCCADCCEADAIGYSVGYVWWIEDELGNYLDTVVYYPLHELAPAGYENAAMPVWQDAAESLVDGVTQASVYNGYLLSHVWDGLDRHGSRLPYGTYRLRFEIGDWDLLTHVTDTDVTLGVSSLVETDTNDLVAADLNYTYTP